MPIPCWSKKQMEGWHPSVAKSASWHCTCRHHFYPFMVFPHHVFFPGYLTLSSSHTTAFLRAIQPGCPPKTLNLEGGLDISKDDPCWDLITQGWTWTILSHLVETQFPQLPTMLQSALNSPNQVMKAANELELAAQLSQYFSLGLELQEAKEKVLAINTCPAEVLKCLTHMVQNYCGGPPAFPFIKVLQAISAWVDLMKQAQSTYLQFLPGGIPYNTYNSPKVALHTCIDILVLAHVYMCICFLWIVDMMAFALVFSQGRNSNIQLLVGQDLMESLAYTNFKQPGEVFTLCRIALWATMLTTWKHQDGIQKLVTKADIEKLKSKTNISKLQLAERQLQGALDVVEKCQDQQHATKCLGRMMIRTILFILQKQKWGKETSKTWKTQDEILEAFTQEMANPKVESLQAAEPLVPRDLAKASSQDMALFQNPHIKLNKLHLALQNCFYSHTYFFSGGHLTVMICILLPFPGTTSRRTTLARCLN